MNLALRNTLPLDFLAGERRAAFATRDEARAAAREAVDGDAQRRPRGIWRAAGGASAGVQVPERFVVGLLRAGRAHMGEPLETVR